MKKRHYIAISVLLLLCLGCFVKGNTISATGKEKKREVVTVENPMDFAKIQITTEGNRTTEGEETTESVLQVHDFLFCGKVHLCLRLDTRYE